MRRIFSIILLSVAGIYAFAADFDFTTEYVAQGGKSGSKVDSVFVVKKAAGVTMSYNADAAYAFTWKSYDADGNVSTLKTYDEPVTKAEVDLLEKSESGYLLDFGNGTLLDIWVFDIKDYKPELDTLIINEDISEQCSFLNISINGEFSHMKYLGYGATGMKYEVDQHLVLTYDSTYYQNKEYVVEEKTYKIKNKNEFVVPAPLSTTYYLVEGSDITMALGDTITAVSSVYHPMAIEIHALASVRIREDALNERDRGEPTEPTEDTEGTVMLKGSAPVNLEVLNYVSEAAFHYEWVLSQNREYKTIQVKSFDKDFRYVFNDKGTYYLKVEVSNGTIDPEVSGCTQIRQFQIDVYDSALEVPNVFTPNGDGINDEFKVAYKSLIKFHGWVYNQWGRKVYEWTDPAQGWDGKLNGKDAPDGTYMYIIEATGDDYDSDGKRVTYRKKGTVSIVR